MIDFTRAMGSAWERMAIILFRPFDPVKWCAIGLSAFLAGLLAGGNGVNPTYRSSHFQPNQFKLSAGSGIPPADLHDLSVRLGHAWSVASVASIIVLAIISFIVMAIFALLLCWLGSRGQFMFLDNIVRNRGAITAPWSHYGRQANSLLVFYLVYTLIWMAIYLPIAMVGFILALPLFQQNRWPVGGEWPGLLGVSSVYLLVTIPLALVLFFFREFGIPIMFRQNLLAFPAFQEALRVVSRFPGSVAAYVLIRLLIFIAVAVLSYVLCCVTCCIGALPYLGTLVLLPILVFVRCFTLDCLAQFSPAYDAFTVDAHPVAAGGDFPANPPPPLG